MTAIDGVLRQSGRSQTESNAQTNATAEKIKQFFSRFEGMITVFTILTGALAAVIWGIKIGLIATAAAGILSLAALGCRSSPGASLVHNDPPIAPIEQILIPGEQIFAIEEPRDWHRIAILPRLDEIQRQQENVYSLRQFLRQLSNALRQVDCHFDNYQYLVQQLTIRFPGVDFATIHLHSLHPVRYNQGQEGFEMIVRSVAPQGWFRLYIGKQGGSEILEEVENLERIDRVAPFMNREALEEAHFDSFSLPFPNTDDLRELIRDDHPDLDLTALEFQSIRKIRFNRDGVMLEGRHFQFWKMGYLINFQTTDGPIQAKVDQAGHRIENVDQYHISNGGW